MFDGISILTGDKYGSVLANITVGSRETDHFRTKANNPLPEAKNGGSHLQQAALKHSLLCGISSMDMEVITL